MICRVRKVFWSLLKKMILLIIGGLCFYKLSKMEVVNLDSGEESCEFPIEKKHTLDFYLLSYKSCKMLPVYHSKTSFIFFSPKQTRLILGWFGFTCLPHFCCLSVYIHRMMETVGDLLDTKPPAIGKRALNEGILGPMGGRGSHKEYQNVKM